jgi:hypothetical protein
MIEIFKVSFDDTDKIFLKYFLLHKIESKLTWQNIKLCGHG